MLTCRIHVCTVMLTLCVILLTGTCRAGAVLRPAGADAVTVFTRSLSAETEISGQFASTTMVIVFQNESESNVEADFIYALPPGAVATYFAYWAGDEKVEAKIVEKKEAARIYEHLTSYRRDPALVEFTGKNTFRARISPVFADQDLKVEIRYVQALESDGDSMRYTVPIGTADSRQPDPLESVDVTVRVRGDAGIRSITNNYGIPVTGESGTYRIAIHGRNYRPEKDLAVRVSREHRPLHADLSIDRTTGHFSLALTPNHSLKHPQVRISGAAVDQIAPVRLPDVRAGRAVVVSGHYRSAGKASVTLTGRSSSGRRTYSAPVDFGTAESSGTASRLWAAARISDLGSKRSNRKAVVDLSFRYGLPSRYTSWLAVPETEQETLRQESVWEKLVPVADKMAVLVADGKRDSPQYSTLAAEYGRLGASLDSDVAPRALHDALSPMRYEAISRIIELRHADKPDAVSEAAWMSRAERISREMNGMHGVDYSGRLTEDIARRERDWLQSQCYRCAEELIRLVAAGKSSTREAGAVRARYLRVGKQIWKSDDQEHECYAGVASNLLRHLADRLVAERHASKPSRSKLAELQAQVKRVESSAGVTSDRQLREAEYSWAWQRLAAQANAYAEAISKGDAKEAEKHLRLFNKYKPSGPPDTADMISQSLRSQYYWLAQDYAAAKMEKTMKPTELKRLYGSVSRLAKLTGNSVEDSIREYDARRVADRLYDSARILHSELWREHPFGSRVERLRRNVGAVASELDKLAKDRPLVKTANEYSAAADRAISAWLDAQKVLAQVQAGTADQGKLDKTAKSRQETMNNLSVQLEFIRNHVRGGDPLISVSAPENAVRVVALLQEGEVKVLAWNPIARRWEGRFDVATGTPDGDYVVEVIVMLPDGTRQCFSVTYKVDTSPPTGSATAAVCDGDASSVRLEVTPDEEIARLVALLPWGERIELRRSGDDGTYSAVVRVPPAAVSGAVTFILTDNAHNRGTVSVNLSMQ